MNLQQLFLRNQKKVPTSIQTSAAPAVSQEDEEFVFGDVLSVNGKTRLKRELDMLKDSNPALYDKIINMK